jgi:hypothetical protein
MRSTNGFAFLTMLNLDEHKFRVRQIINGEIPNEDGF